MFVLYLLDSEKIKVSEEIFLKIVITVPYEHYRKLPPYFLEELC